MYSKAEVDWPEAEDDRLVIQSNRDRIVVPLGDKGAVVQKFYSKALSRRWKELCDHGCSWDWPEYQPHVTITWNANHIDLTKVEPYTGPIMLGPEVFEAIDESWKDKITEKNHFNLFKYDKKLGLIFGWAIISKIGNHEYFDTQGDHIPEDAMLEAATEFMLKRRTLKLMHRGESKGDVVFAWPMTEDIMKAMRINSQTTGLMVAVKPTSKQLIEAAEQGILQGFSIGGYRLVDEEVD